MAKLSLDSPLTREELNDVLSYDQETGKFTWLKRFGRACIGAEAGRKAGNGYIRLRLFGREYSAHRMAWFWMFGEWPKQPLDHINGDKSDNRISNLRLASVAQNSWNMKPRKNARSRFKGVCFIKHMRKWRSQITVSGVTYTLGYFEDERDAAKAYDLKAAELQGDFARPNLPDLVEGQRCDGNNPIPWSM